jgi:hypothetical protein
LTQQLFGRGLPSWLRSELWGSSRTLDRYRTEAVPGDWSIERDVACSLACWRVGRYFGGEGGPQVMGGWMRRVGASLSGAVACLSVQMRFVGCLRSKCGSIDTGISMCQWCENHEVEEQPAWLRATRVCSNGQQLPVQMAKYLSSEAGREGSRLGSRLITLTSSPTRRGRIGAYGWT